MSGLFSRWRPVARLSIFSTQSAPAGQNAGHAAYLLGALAVLLWLPLPLGAVTAWGWPVLASALVIGCAAYVWQYPAHARQVAGAQRWLLGVWTLLILWHGLFLLPLPFDWVAVLRPYQTFFTSAESDPWLSLSYQNADTWLSLSRTLSYACLFLLTLWTCRTPARVVWVLAAVLIAGLGQALYAALQLFSGSAQSLVLDLPLAPGASGTFLTSPAFAHLLVLALGAALGLLLSQIRPRRQRNARQRLRRVVLLFFSYRALLRLAALLLLAALVLTAQPVLSWVTALAVGGAMLLVVAMIRPRPRQLRRLVYGTVLACALAVLASEYLASQARVLPDPPGPTLEERQWPSLAPQPGEHPWLGAGPAAWTVYAQHAPRIPLPGQLPVATEQGLTLLMAEWGLASLAWLALLVAGVLVAGLALAWRRHPLWRGGALAALVGGLASVLMMPFFPLWQTPASVASLTVLLALALVCLQCRSSARKECA